MYKSSNKTVKNLVALSGHIIERYDVTLYGYLTIILTPIFFPETSSNVSILYAMGAFAAGYFLRPFGGLIFGFIGDRYGRKQALLNSILLVSFPTFIIGILPSYKQIGLFAPLIIIFCRLIQGLCVGGEYSGANVYFYEHAKKNKQGFSGGIMCSTAFSGAVLGTLVSFFSGIIFSSSLSWRFPFLLGGVFSLLIYFARKRIEETPDFLHIQEKKTVLKYPFIEVLKNKKRTIFYVSFISAQGHAILYIITIYMNSYLFNEYGLNQEQVMLNNMFILITWVIFIFLFGFISDKIPKIYFLSFLSFFMFVLSYPLFWYVSQCHTLHSHILFQIVLSIIGAGFYGISSGYLPGLFKVQERYSGMAIGQTCSQAIIGGTAPLAASFLVNYTKNPVSPAFLLMVISILGFFSAVKIIKENLQNPTETV